MSANTRNGGRTWRDARLRVLCPTALLLLLSTSSLMAASPALDHDLSRLVFVTEDVNMDAKGCDAVSVFDLDQDEAVYHGRHFTSPGRLTATSDFTTVLAGISMRMPNPRRAEEDPFILWERYKPDREIWETVGLVMGDAFAAVGGLGLLADDDTLLIATVNDIPPERTPPNPGPLWPAPYHLRKYRVSEFHQSQAGQWRVGPLRGDLFVSGVVSEVLPSRTSSLAHLLLDDGWVLTIDPADMREVLPRIRLPRISQRVFNPDRWVAMQHGALSPDERFLISNRLQPAEIIVADLKTRQAWSNPVPRDVSAVSGLAFNWAWNNRGLIAVHGGETILLYRMDDLGQLELLGRTPKPGGYAVSQLPYVHGPFNTIAWSGDGRNIIAGVMGYTEDDSEFASFRVEDDGQSTFLERRFTACPAPWDAGADSPNDILTANGLVTPPATASATPSEWPAASASPTVTPSSTAVPSRTASSTSSPPPSQTSTRQPPPAPLYLPLLLRSGCASGARWVDVALIIDLSTSMGRLGAEGRSKIDGLADALLAFIDRLLADDPGHRIALVGFHHRAFLLHEASSDAGQLKKALGSLQLRLEEGTRLDLALELGASSLPGPAAAERAQALILLTDGLPNQVPTPPGGGSMEATVLQAAQRAKAGGMTLYTIGYGRADAPDPLDRIHESLLRSIATSPAHFRQTTDPDALTTIYQDLAEALPCAPGGREAPETRP